jgi:hypothetical protein
MRQIFYSAGYEIVQAQHRPAFREQPVAQMRTQESGCPGHHCPHESS